MFEFIDVKYKDIVDIPNLQIHKGFTAIFGHSGSGKSTLLRMLNKMISPTHGQILYNGQDLSEINSVSHRRNVIMLSQEPAMFAGTIRDNLIMPFTFQEKQEPDDQILYQVISKVQLEKELDIPVMRLSGGEKQRLALGRVFLCDPSVYLLDEPSSALDHNTEDVILNMVSEHVKAAEKSVVMVTHSKVAAEKYASQIIEMSGGRIVNGERE